MTSNNTTNRPAGTLIYDERPPLTAIELEMFANLEISQVPHLARPTGPSVASVAHAAYTAHHAAQILTHVMGCQVPLGPR